MATVIKAGEAGTVVRRLATVDLADHLREAQSVIDAARARATAMVRAAQREAEGIREAARSEGLHEGLEKGVREGRTQGYEMARGEALAAFTAQQDSLVSALSIAVDALSAMKMDLEIAARRDVLEFAVHLVRKLTFAIGTLHRESAQENLHRSLALIGKHTDVTVRVNSADREALALFAPALVERLGGSGRVNVVTDETLAPGGCRVHTPDCDVDATLETQTEELIRLLLGETVTAAAAQSTGVADV